MSEFPSRDISPVSAVVLAGGRGTRLGGDKAAVELAGETLLQRAVRLVSQLTDDIIVVTRDDQRLRVARLTNGASVLSDTEPYEGVLAGMATGLSAARHAWCLVVACDMPFVSLGLVRYMLCLRRGYDAVVPRLEVGMEPLLSLYHRRCLPPLWSALEAGKRRVASFFGSLRVRYVEAAEIHGIDPTGRSFHNINAPDDLRQAREWLRAESASPE